jgi:hypothetical protein
MIGYIFLNFIRSGKKIIKSENKMIIKIQVTGPRASRKSTILDQIESFLQIKGFEVKRTGNDGHGLLAKFEPKIVYTVPAHVGVNIEVPRGSKISYYDPK